MSTCGYWNPSDCAGSPECPPRCPRFIDKHGRSLTIREYRARDRDPLERLYRSYGTDHRAQGLPPLTDRRIERWLDTLLAEGTNVIAADERGRIVGHAVYTPRKAPEPELAVFVSREDHDRGIGTECCRQVIARAAAAGREALVLSVERTNRRAVVVYRGLGFETVEGRGTEMRMRRSLSVDGAPELQSHR